VKRAPFPRTAPHPNWYLCINRGRAAYGPPVSVVARSEAHDRHKTNVRLTTGPGGSKLPPSQAVGASRRRSPGGGGARCQETSDPLERTFFYVDADTGDSIGQFTIPRPQTNVENCTTHNYNVVPQTDRYVMVSGNYQSGISVIDFTDPAGAQEIAYADPAPLVDPDPPVGIELGGDWSSYWYDGRIYESDITRGLIIWDLSDSAVAGARKLGRLNPQTQEFTLD
jgi:hypothetical protein